MCRLIVLIAIVGAAAAVPPASAAEIWSCEKDGRLAGRPTGDCVFDVEPGAYELLFEPAGARASGEARVSIAETGGPVIDFTCLAVNEVVVSCEASDGDLSSTPDGATLAFDVAAPATIRFEGRPPLCGTVTCTGRDPVVSAGKLRVTLSPVD